MATTLKSALEETEEIIFSVVEGLLAKTGITAKEVHFTDSHYSFHSSQICERHVWMAANSKFIDL